MVKNVGVTGNCTLEKNDPFTVAVQCILHHYLALYLKENEFHLRKFMAVACINFDGYCDSFALSTYVHIKGSLISESFSFWLQSPKKYVKSLSCPFFFRWISIAQDRDLAYFLGDWSHNEKLSEIMPPLIDHHN